MKISNLLKVVNSKGTSFCAVRGYNSKSTGEIANYTVINGYSYENANQHDLAILNALTASDIQALAVKVGYAESMVQDAINALIKSIVAPNATLSKAQTDTYTQLGSGIKEYAGDNAELNGNIYVTGLIVRKSVLVAGTKKEVNSKPATICKKKVSKALDLRKDKIRQFIVNRGEYKLRGVSL
jgi:hypothetical protein